MKQRWIIRLTAALLCLGVSLSAGWLWQSLATFQFEAAARISLTGDPFTSGPAGAARSDASAEERILSPEVVSAAAGLLAERNVPLSLGSPFDSVTDYLLDHTQVVVPESGEIDDVRLISRAESRDEALQIVTALVDACLATAKASLPEQPASRADDTAAERKHLADAIIRQQRAIEDMASRLQEMKSSSQPQDDPVILEAESVAARRTSDAAQHRLVEARHDFENQVPAETVAARIASDPVRTKTLNRLHALKLKEERSQQEALRQKWAAIYGRNHPRMTEIRQKIELLQQQISSAAAGTGGDGAGDTETSPAAIVLGALEAEAAELAAVEQKLETRRTAVRQRLSEQQGLETVLSDTRQELTFLHSEHDRLKRQTESGRHEQQGRLPAVIEPPAPLAGQRGPRAGLPMAVSCVAGMSLYLLILWQFRAQLPPIDVASIDMSAVELPPTVTLKPVSAPRRERFRSPAEEQLRRLKMLSTHVESSR